MAANEDMLVAGVEARLAQRKKEERSRLTKDITRVWAPPIGGVLVIILFNLFFPVVARPVYLLLIVLFSLGCGCLVVIGRQHKRIVQLEARMRMLEDHLQPNKLPEATPSQRPPAAPSPSSVAPHP